MSKKLIPSRFISKLDLSNRGLREIPNEVFELKNLKKLNLSNNKISKVSKEIEKLTSLETLDLSYNRIENFYAKLCTLKKLKRLNLNNNYIKTIPKQITGLENLRSLSIANNRLINLPEQLGKLGYIRKLNISGNEFNNKFPYVLFNIKPLEYLWLNRIPFKDFPPDYLLSNSLKALYCYSKNLTYDKLDSNYKELSSVKGNCLEDSERISKIQMLEFEDFIPETTIKKENIESKHEQRKIEKQNGYNTKIFISYSHEDGLWLKEVKKHLKVLNHQGIDFDAWDDKRIRAGKEWKKEIENALAEAKIAILLVSTAFLASDFIQSNELPVLLDNAKKKGTVIISLIVKPCRFNNDKRLSQFQAVNSPSEALSSLPEPEQDKVLVRLVDDIEHYIHENK